MIDERPAFADLIPKAQLLLLVAMQGLLCTDPTMKNVGIAADFRCRWCKSPRTRYRLIAADDASLTFRCLRCGGLHEFLVPPDQAVAA